MTRPKFQSERQEANWYHTSEGRALLVKTFEAAARAGKDRFRNGAKPLTGPEAKVLLEQVRAQGLNRAS